jgi:hypothetical protein
MGGFVFGADLGMVSFLEITVLGDVLCGGLVRIFSIELIVLLGLAFATNVDFGSFLPFGYAPGYGANVFMGTLKVFLDSVHCL